MGLTVGLVSSCMTYSSGMTAVLAPKGYLHVTMVATGGHVAEGAVQEGTDSTNAPVTSDARPAGDAYMRVMYGVADVLEVGGALRFGGGIAGSVESKVSLWKGSGVYISLAARLAAGGYWHDETDHANVDGGGQFLFSYDTGPVLLTIAADGGTTAFFEDVTLVAPRLGGHASILFQLDSDFAVGMEGGLQAFPSGWADSGGGHMWSVSLVIDFSVPVRTSSHRPLDEPPQHKVQ